jgi:orotate phosphoribosyltransferase
MTRLAGFYADAIVANGLDFDCLFGPAYKGIPLCVSVAMELSRRGRDVPFCFNRKEAKDHGEGGTLVGYTPRSGDRILIVEDVTTAGTSIRETVPVLRATADVQIAGLVVSVDRMEKGASERSALADLRAEFGLDAFSIVTIDEVMSVIFGGELQTAVALDADWRRRYSEYRDRWGGRD